MNLASVAPGIRSFATSAGCALPTAGALPELRFINMYADGAEWKSLYNGNLVGIPQTGSPYPQDAVQEFRAILSPFDAEYTRGGSYVISVITRRGTNDFHAEAFSFLRDKSLNTRGPFEKTKPNYSRQQMGFTVSGPLIKDKLFIMASYEDQNSNEYIDVVPGRPAYNPGIWDKYAGTFEAPNENQIGVLRLTYQHDNDNTFDYIWSARYLASKTNFGGTVSEAGGIYGQYHINSHMLKWTDIISPKMFNEMSFRYLRWRHYEPAILNGPAYSYPSITIGTSGFPIKVEEDHFTLNEKLTFSIEDFYGPHTLKIGGLAALVTMTPWAPGNLNPSFSFATDTSALPRTAAIGVGVFNPLDPNGKDATTDDKGNTIGFYIQDQWNPWPQLTINLGLRYDVEINTLNNTFRVPWADSTNLTGLISPDWINRGDRKNDWSNIAPRLSFNYDLFGTGKTILRGGYGITFDRTAYAFAYFERRDASWRQYQFTFNTTTNLATLDPAELRRRVSVGSVSAAPAINVMNQQMRTPRVAQFSLGIGQQVTDEIGLNIDYVNSHGSNLYTPINVNYVNTAVTPSARVLTSKYGDINLWGSIAAAWNHAFLSTLAYNTPTMRWQLSYTLSWSFSQSDAITTARTSTALLAMQRSSTDERHRVVLSGTYLLPWDFKVSAVATISSPLAFTVIDGRDLNKNNTTGDDWINGVRTQFKPYNEVRWWYKMFDLRVSKVFNIANAKVELMVDAFNLFNWFNASGYSGTMNDQSGNKLLNFGLANGTYAPRQVQGGLRVTY
ncbi:MAG: TonB-dependent receptor [Ignavibacteria bacterium]|nr:TonB-dependent receptor [Ignavibacteria bacterium]